MIRMPTLLKIACLIIYEIVEIRIAWYLRELLSLLPFGCFLILIEKESPKTSCIFISIFKRIKSVRIRNEI